MGMTGIFYALPEADAKAILERPERACCLWGSEPPSPPQPFFARLFGLKPPTAPIDPWRLAAEPKQCYVDKAWHGIHFLLTGTAWGGKGPLAFIATGGESFDFEDRELRVIDRLQVKEIAGALAALNLDELFSAAIPANFGANDIYPDIWSSEPKEECIGYVVDFLKDLVAFMQASATGNLAVIVQIG